MRVTHVAPWRGNMIAMRKFRVLATLLALALLALPVSALELEVIVKSGNEGAVDKLTAEDFQLRFGGKDTPVANARYVDGLSETKIYIGAEMPPNDFPLVRDGIARMIDELPEGLEVSLGGAPFTADKSLLKEHLEHGVELVKNTPSAGFERIWNFGQGYRVQGRPILNSYAALASQLAAVPGQKRVIMYRPALELRQDGLDTREMNIRTQELRQNDANMLRNEDDLYRLGTIAAVSRVRFYTANSSNNVSGLTAPGLNSVSLHTGGEAVLGGSNASDVIRKAIEDAPPYYVISIDPPLEGKGARKNLKAEIAREGFDAKLARGFLIDLPGIGQLGGPPEDLLSKTAAESTLDIQAEHWVFRGPDGKPMVLLSAGAPIAELETADDGKGATVELALAGGLPDGDGWTTTASRGSRQVFDKKAFAKAQKDGGVAVDVSAWGELPGPGMHAWKTVLKNQSDGRVGVVESQVGVHDLSLPMSTSDVLLTRRAVPVEDAGPEPWGDLLDFGGSRLIPESTREFKVGEPVLFTYRLYNAPAQMIQNPPPVQLALFKDEQQLDSFEGQGQSRVIEGSAEIQYVGSIQTKGLAPGEYLILSAVPGREDERQPYVEGAFRLVKK